MKKFFMFALIAIMTIAFGGVAMAATELKVSGTNEMGGYYIDNMGAGDYAPVAFMSYEKNDINLAFMVAKNLGLKVRLTANIKPWGRNQTANGNYNTTTSYASTVSMTEARVEWVSPIGFLRFGRYVTPEKSGIGVAGKFGAADSMVGANRYWTKSELSVDRIVYVKGWGMYKLTLLYEKLNESDNNTAVADQDQDLYYMDNKISWKNGGLDIVVQWLRLYSAPTVNINKLGLGVIFGHKVGPVNIAFVINYAAGTREVVASGAKTDYAGLDYYIEAEYQAKRIMAGAGYGYTNGQDSSSKLTAGGGIGRGFQPLYALFGQYDGLLYNKGNNLSVLVGWFDMAVTSNMWIHVGAGMASTPQLDSGRTSKEVGSELDFGFKYIAAKGLDFQIHIGYFMPGAYFANGENVLHADWLMTLNY